ncbi:Holliday junction resolvase RuvX [Phragmitibacter flavus]|uniref:Putative pre-16S rRNA nuclease n=1 Tax=Phragmitibacter flavus TaxID=2576071 RepID=A0A5R8KJ98_9BACT|nr:Holliday junction resolvase RuvX [Phragmitibacter flavus]TLD72384.1 Holliday junction resolvase RuvX [Phragmitibacter flavus]
MSRTLGIDHGTVRIGLALSDDMGMFAHPLKTLDSSPSVEKQIAEIVQQKRVTEIVIGLPLRMDGHHGSATERVEKFADKLRKHLPHEIPIIFVDERLSSKTAERSLGLENKQKTREEKKLVDQISAVAILQDHLNTQAGPDAWLLPEDS